MSKGANHICKNINCPNGVNGEPKHYYACNYCDRTNKWRSVACSMECYDEYMKQVVEARSKNKEVNLLPIRTDKTEKEVIELLEKPVGEVLADTVEDLKEYLDGSNTITEVIEAINEELDAEPVTETVTVSTSKKKKRTKNI